MAKLLEVREFDNITGNPDFADDPRYKYLEPDAFQELIEFIDEFAVGEESSGALEFMNTKRVPNVGQVITVKNYVGLIQMKNVGGSSHRLHPRRRPAGLFPDGRILRRRHPGAAP